MNQHYQVRPMLAHSLKSDEDVCNKITFPVGVSPKLDGVRMLVLMRPDKPMRMLSRSGKVFKHLNTIGEHLKKMHVEAPLILDGELYKHNVPFDAISGAVRRAKDPGPHVEYHIFDLVSQDAYANRVAYLKQIARVFRRDLVIKFVFYTEAWSMDDVRCLHGKFVRQGYEGAIIRNLTAPYDAGKRSWSLVKLKTFDNAEFVVTGFKSGTGVDRNTIVFELTTSAGETFYARPKGTHEARRNMYHSGQAYIGKPVTVCFFGLTSKGIPRFPVVVSLRDYE